MPLLIIDGDLLNAFDRGEVTQIGHVCNAQGVMGSGIALSIKQRYPAVYGRYRRFYDEGLLHLGVNVPVGVGWESEAKVIHNLVAQNSYGMGIRHLNYGALGKSLSVMAERCNPIRDVVGFPFNMGAYRAGGDWNIVLEMIEFYFKAFEVKIYKLTE